VTVSESLAFQWKIVPTLAAATFAACSVVRAVMRETFIS